MEIDLKPALDEKTLDKRLLADFDKHKNSDFINALGELLPKKIIPVVIEKSGIDPREKVNSITKAQRAALLRVLKAFPVEISGSVRSPRRLSPRAAYPSARSAENHGVQKAAAPVFRR